MIQGLWDKICSPQSLRGAWTRVKDNQGSAGIDQVTIEQFEQNLEQNLTGLQSELESGDCQSLPIRRGYIDKEDGTKRPIGIPAIRDRVVQQSLLSALSPIFEPEFLDCSFAYRPSRSALNAISRVEALLKDGLKWVLDGDIESFFDSIDHALLLSFVEERVSDNKALKLLHGFLKVGVFENMTLREDYSGIAQGNAISPLLANIYLHRFDQELIQKGYHLIRYADDFIILEDSQERIGRALADTAVALKGLRLNLNQKKTRLTPAREGFVFLGYYIDDRGKGPSRKAIQAISQKLRQVSEANKRKDINERVEDLKQVIRGWAGYFRTCRGVDPEDSSVLVALAEISLELGDEENARKLLNKRNTLTIENADIHYQVGHLAQTLGMKEEVLDEFSRALTLDPDHFQAKEALGQMELVDEDIYASIERLRRLIHFCPDLPQAYRDLAFCYAEIGEYGLAQESYRKALELETETTREEKLPLEIPPPVEVTQLAFSEQDMLLFHSLFRGKEGFFARQWIDERGRRGFYPESGPLNPEAIKRHLGGEETLGLYLIAEGDKVYLSVIDVDINQKALLEYAKDENRLAELHHLTHQDARRIASVCDDLGVSVIIEDSGYKGRHLWFFFASSIPAKLARRFLRFLCERAGQPSAGVHWEIFPNCDGVREKRFGPLIKLPLGIHKRANRRCLFLDREGNALPEQMMALSQVSPISQQKAEEILLAYGVKPKAAVAKREEESTLVKNLLSGCKVINYLVDKARNTHYLDNSERVTLLYTLGHLGEEGRAFLHKVISNCINYDYDFTEKQIQKMKPYPISCARIREKHEDFALDLGCNCNLNIPPKGYPSPILHAFNQPKSWPISGVPSAGENTEISPQRGISRNEVNTKLRRYIELKKQLRGVEKSIQRIEEEMASYLDELGTDNVETDYGILVRRKAGDSFDWVIKL